MSSHARYFKLALLGLISLGFAACSQVTSVDSEQQTQAVSIDNKEAAPVSGDNADPRIEYEERGFADKLSIREIKSRHKNDVLQVTATLHNKWLKPLRFSYQLRFFDADGFPLNAQTRPWQPLLLQGKDSIAISASAANPDAQLFKIVVKRE